MGLLDKAKAKLAYERESWRMGQEHLKKVAQELPFPKFSERIRMTDADLERWRRQQRQKRQ